MQADFALVQLSLPPPIPIQFTDESHEACIVDIPDLLIQFVTSVGGTFVGAWAAFQLNIHESKKKMEDEQVAAANRALFILLTQLNMLADIKQKFIDTVIDDPARFINMNALPPLENPAPQRSVTKVVHP